MLVLGPIGFTAPWVFLALALLPILWLLLRAVPPAPLRARFPGVALLLGLKDDDVEADRTPWWLLALRMLAIAALIFAFAGPVLNPRTERGGQGPLLVLLDGGWASAQDWTLRMGRVAQALDDAAASDRVLCVLAATEIPPEGCSFLSAADWRSGIAGLTPQPYLPDYSALQTLVSDLPGQMDTLWLSDGIARAARAEVFDALNGRGVVTVFENAPPLYVVGPMTPESDGISLALSRRGAGPSVTIELEAHGPDPAGVPRILATQEVVFEAGQSEVLTKIALPAELRNRITRFQIAGQRTAGSTRLTDDSVKRREVALVSNRDDGEQVQLLSQLHYLRAGLSGKADVIEGALSDLLAANPDVIVLADIAQLSAGETAPLLDWIDAGGMLLRFAGPNLAASDIARDGDDPLMPVRLRSGGRSVGGAMSWGAPKELRPFAETSPFYGLEVPGDVAVTSQVLAQPDPNLSQRVIAALTDGTPLVTRKSLGQGQVVFFHVTANAEWSTLPLSGLFVNMLDRLVHAGGGSRDPAQDLAGKMLQAVKTLDGFGRLEDAPPRAPIKGEAFATASASKDTPPGLYQSGEASVALNAFGAADTLTPMRWPAAAQIESNMARAEFSLVPPLLTAALIALLIDIFAALFVSGRLAGAGPIGPGQSGRVLSAALALGITVTATDGLRAQDVGDTDPDLFALAASNDVTFAYVVTGEARVDELSKAGLEGLSRVLYQRTSVEPNAPIGVDLDRDELGFFPMLYWPITTGQPIPSAEAYTKLNAYLRTGGMIVFDTRDADVAAAGATSPASVRLQVLARPLDIPPLERVNADHVITRSFYLLQDFPGRHPASELWVEASVAPSVQAEGMPFRNLNDNVTPVVIGGGDWAAAWATDATGFPMVQVGRGFSGEQQREIAFRFGVNLVMYVLTGSYKSDQVHVPALLERLGQ